MSQAIYFNADNLEAALTSLGSIGFETRVDNSGTVNPEILVITRASWPVDVEWQLYPLLDGRHIVVASGVTTSHANFATALEALKQLALLSSEAGHRAMRQPAARLSR